MLHVFGLHDIIAMASSSPPTYHLHPPSDVTSNLLAPSSLPWYIGKPLGLLTITAYIAILPAYLAYQTATYYAVGPPWPGWTLGTMLFTRGLRLLLQFLFKFGLPGADSNAWKVPIGAKVKGVGVECRKIPGIPKTEEDELRIGWARQRDVQVVDVPGFMLWPETQKNNVTNGHANNFEKRQSPAVAGSSYALANDSEKIVYYLVGGGYISGHPLRTHLAWTTSQKLNVRVFGKSSHHSFIIANPLPHSCKLPKVIDGGHILSCVSPRRARRLSLPDARPRLQTLRTSRRPAQTPTTDPSPDRTSSSWATPPAVTSVWDCLGTWVNWRNVHNARRSRRLGKSEG